MNKYYTKYFRSDVGIDEWLNSFEKDDGYRCYSNMEVIGYVVIKDTIVITVKVFEIKSK
jgi:hypothetical protein